MYFALFGVSVYGNGYLTFRRRHMHLHCCQRARYHTWHYISSFTIMSASTGSGPSQVDPLYNQFHFDLTLHDVDADFIRWLQESFEATEQSNIRWSLKRAGGNVPSRPLPLEASVTSTSSSSHTDLSTPASSTIVSTSTLPHVVSYCQLMHRMRTDNKGKEVCDSPTLLESAGEVHSNYPYVSQIVMCASASAFGNLAKFYGYCVRVSASYHEPNTTFEGCTCTSDCVHISAALYKCSAPTSVACNGAEHVIVNMTSIPKEDRTEYQAAMKEFERYMNHETHHMVRG